MPYTLANAFTDIPGLSDVVVQDLQTLVWFGDVDLMVRAELGAVLHSGKHTGVAIMDQPSRISHGLQHSGLNLCKTHNYFSLHSYLHTYNTYIHTPSIYI